MYLILAGKRSNCAYHFFIKYAEAIYVKELNMKGWTRNPIESTLSMPGSFLLLLDGPAELKEVVTEVIDIQFHTGSD